MPATGLRDITAHYRLADLSAVLSDQPLPDPTGGMPLLARHTGIRRHHPLMIGFHGTSDGATRTGRFPRKGTADANTCHTARR